MEAARLRSIYSRGVIFKRVGDGRPYPDHGLTSRAWAAVPPRQVRLDELVTTKDTLQLAALLDEDSTFFGDLFAHVVRVARARLPRGRPAPGAARRPAAAQRPARPGPRGGRRHEHPRRRESGRRSPCSASSLLLLVGVDLGLVAQVTEPFPEREAAADLRRHERRRGREGLPRPGRHGQRAQRRQPRGPGRPDHGRTWSATGFDEGEPATPRTSTEVAGVEIWTDGRGQPGGEAGPVSFLGRPRSPRWSDRDAPLPGINVVVGDEFAETWSRVAAFDRRQGGHRRSAARRSRT